jgi:hypothetical protein
MMDNDGRDITLHLKINTTKLDLASVNLFPMKCSYTHSICISEHSHNRVHMLSSSGSVPKNYFECSFKLTC